MHCREKLQALREESKASGRGQPLQMRLGHVLISGADEYRRTSADEGDIGLHAFFLL